MSIFYGNRKLHTLLVLLLTMGMGMEFPRVAAASGAKNSRATYIEQPGDTWMTNTPPQKSRRKRNSRKAERVTSENKPAPHMIVVPKPERHAALEHPNEPVVQLKPIPNPNPAPEVKKKNPLLVLMEKWLYRNNAP